MRLAVGVGEDTARWYVLVGAQSLPRAVRSKRSKTVGGLWRRPRMMMVEYQKEGHLGKMLRVCERPTAQLQIEDAIGDLSSNGSKSPRERSYAHDREKPRKTCERSKQLRTHGLQSVRVNRKLRRRIWGTERAVPRTFMNLSSTMSWWSTAGTLWSICRECGSRSSL